jgi:hypothetical protein
MTSEIKWEQEQAAALARELAAPEAPTDDFTLSYLADVIAVAKAVTEEGVPRSELRLPPRSE